MGNSHLPGALPTTGRVAGIARVRSATGAKVSAAAVSANGARVSHPERVIDAASGLTKGHLANYYERVAALMRPHVHERPVSLVRAPAGVEGPHFFQRHATPEELPGLERVDPNLYPGHEPLLVIPSKSGLMSAVQMNVMEFHTWNATFRALDRPDRMVFDLDPGRGVDWPDVLDGARLVHEFLDQLGLKSFLKTSGGAGLHLVVPLSPEYDWDTVRQVSKTVVARLADANPERFVLKSGPQNRVGRIFIDYLRNGISASTACAWSVRARPGLGVSVPAAWRELHDLRSGAHWTLANVAPRLRVGNTPWKTYSSSRRGLGPAMKSLNIEPGDEYE